MKKLLLRIAYFFALWGSYYYETRIDASFAWDLAGVYAEYDEEIGQWSELCQNNHIPPT